ncbi:hypothetical protein UFOVP190_219 [uncultured Caudovirales phage]|uniref:Uncharacterized protein n=1 Tax=uncultured Caudovirales phage TaxID=2100421 RepID=A0A6J7WGM3_9CAUD|nr:hypothetical protein UFOVP190_219 [uncultured Caudovirales phage]
MAIQTRYAGDAQGVNNVDATTDGTLATIIATGLTKNPTAIKIALGKSQAFAATDSATGGPVETILRTIALDSTIVMYQVDTNQLSVLVEAAGNTTTNIGTRITAQGNLSTTLGTGNVWANAATVSSTTGFKIA